MQDEGKRLGFMDMIACVVGDCLGVGVLSQVFVGVDAVIIFIYVVEIGLGWMCSVIFIESFVSDLVLI